MKKTDIKLDISTPEKAKKVYHVLKAYAQPIYKSTKEGIKKGDNGDFDQIYFYSEEWVGTRNKAINCDIPQLIQILEEEQNTLSGKVAIQVDNEREFNAMMIYYDSKGLKWRHGLKPLDYKFISKTQLTDYFNGKKEISQWTQLDAESAGYKIIPFKDFVKIAGIDYMDKVEINMGNLYVTVNEKTAYIGSLELTHSEIAQIHKACQQFK